MADQRAITLHQGNDETLLITIDRQDDDDDLTAVTKLELFLAQDNCASDDDPTTLMLTSDVPSEITIVLPRTPAVINATAYIPRQALSQSYNRWWRIDGLNTAGQRRTAMYGAVTVINV